MSPAKVLRLSERIRHIARQEDKIAEIAADVDGLDVQAHDQAARLTGVAEVCERIDGKVDQLLARVDGAEVHAMRAGGAARRAEEAADRVGALSVEDVQRVASALEERIRKPIAAAGKQGVARGVGATLASASLLVVGGFAAAPVEFVEAVTKMFGGG